MADPTMPIPCPDHRLSSSNIPPSAPLAPPSAHQRARRRALRVRGEMRAPTWLLLTALCCVSAEQFETIQPIENPHARSFTGGDEKVCEAGMSSCPALAGLDVTQVISSPLATQPDTLLGIVRKVYMGREVPIYHFKQSSRLNPDQLPFKLVLVRNIPMEGAMIIPVDSVSAADSWFTGYSWDVVVCQQCDGWRHLGWRFTSASTGEAFTALIVDYSEGARREADARTRALEALTVGVRAPAWVLALAGVAISSANGVPKP